MDNVNIVCGRHTPFEFLPNFTPTPEVDLSKLVNMDLKVEGNKITGVPKEFDGKLPPDLAHLEIDWEAVEKNRDLEENYHIP